MDQFLDYATQAAAQLPVLYQGGNVQQNQAPNVIVVQQFILQLPMQLQHPAPLAQPTFLPIEGSFPVPIPPQPYPVLNKNACLAPFLPTFVPVEGSIPSVPVPPPTDTTLNNSNACIVMLSPADAGTVLALDSGTWIMSALPNLHSIEAPGAQPVQPPPDVMIPDMQSRALVDAPVESLAACARTEADSSEVDQAENFNAPNRNKQRYPYEPKDLKAAIEAVRTGRLKIKESVKKYGIPRGTLSSRLYGWKRKEKNPSQAQKSPRLQPIQPYTTMEHVAAAQSLPAPPAPTEPPPYHNTLSPEQLTQQWSMLYRQNTYN